MLRVAFVLLLVVAVAACRSATVYNVTQSQLNVSQKASMADISQSIKRAGAGLGWQINEVSPGVLTGRLNLRTHMALVDITHDTKTFSIRYKDSTNLDYTGNNIHSNYNGWIQNLERAIVEHSSTV